MKNNPITLRGRVYSGQKVTNLIPVSIVESHLRSLNTAVKALGQLEREQIILEARRIMKEGV